MSTSKKTEASIRQGGPGASQENAKAPLEIEKSPAESDGRAHSKVSGGGERDKHHSHASEAKGGGSKPA